MAYVKRRIDVTVQIAKGDFGTKGFDTVKMTGLRVIAKINKAVASSSHAEVRIFGAPPNVMQKISTVGYEGITRGDSFVIEAGDDGTQLSQVFVGTISDAYVDAQGSPEVALVIVGFTAHLGQLRPTQPTSYRAGTDIVTILTTMANYMNFRVENNGVSGVVATDAYYPGTAMDQITALCEHFSDKIGWTIDFLAVIIWPKAGHRGGLIPRIEAATGLVGYPSYNARGPVVTVLYAPGVSIGGLIDLHSIIYDDSQTTWFVYGLNYNLSSEAPGGPWFMQLSCQTPTGVRRVQQ